MNRDWNPESTGFEEEDFRIVSEWGFNFVRLPLDYRYWIKDGDRKNWDVFDEAGFRKVDAAVELGRKYGVHVQICLHRISGYSSGTPSEPTDIFSDPESLRVACLHWRAIARRYKGVPNDVLTFNLFNEPPYIDEAKYVPVAKARLATEELFKLTKKLPSQSAYRNYAVLPYLFTDRTPKSFIGEYIRRVIV